MLSFTEENYMKAIYHIAGGGKEPVSTNEIASALETRAASVTDMIKKLSGKKMLSYEKYRGVKLTPKGMSAALMVIRKHRLWETFLVDKLGFNWDEVHEVAEQLEHIQSPRLIEKLDVFLGYPSADPHGDPIPDRNGKFKEGPTIPVSEMKINEKGTLAAVGKDDSSLLRFLDKFNLKPGAKLRVVGKMDLDGSIEIETETGDSVYLSSQVSTLLLIRKN